MKTFLRLEGELAGFVSSMTKEFINGWTGKLFLNFMLIGPFTFLPTVLEAWTAPNIDVFRTPTWPIMMVINTSVYVSLTHNGDWRTRIVMILWIIVMAMVWFATLFR